MREVIFYRMTPDATVPTLANKSAIGYDLYALEDVIIPSAKVVAIRTGIVAKAPWGYHFELCLRSGTPVKKSGLVLANGIGIIDPDYCGPEDEIKILVLNTNPVEDSGWAWGPIKIKKGERIAQLILRENVTADIREGNYEALKASDSRGGFGSTGE